MNHTEVVALAAQAHHAERISFKVFVNTMKQRATYFYEYFLLKFLGKPQKD